MEIEPISTRNSNVTAKSENYNETVSNLASHANIQALFRGYIIRKYFYFSLSSLVSIPELFSSLSIFRSNLSSILPETILGVIEKHGIYFSLEELSEISWNIQKSPLGVYFGEIDDKSLPNGKGIFIFLDKMYEGYWKFGKRHGMGRQIDYHGNIYIGSYASDKKNGKGKNVWANGDTFDGSFLDGLRCGFGIYHSEKFHIEGEHKDGILNGYGKYIKKDEYAYEGNFLNGKFNGNGHCVFANTGEYFGNFQDGFCNGKGVFISTINGCIYEGEFHQSLKNGFFTHIYPQGFILQHFWVNDVKTGEYIQYRQNSHCIEEKGYFVNGEKHNHMDKITRNIYLGDEIAGNDKVWLGQVGIKAIARILSDEKINYLPEIAYLDLNANDTKPENLVKCIRKVSKFINTYKGFKILFLSLKEPVKGTAILIGYFMKAKKMKLKEAFNRIKAKRKHITLTEEYVKKFLELECNGFKYN